ncbi:hypothetical protein ACQ4PT_026242 [Festuca glaucescens]
MDHASVTPRRLSYDLLKEITDGFSEERKLGSGGYGKVYKGVHKDGETMAVKLLYDMPGLDDEQFKREFNNLMCLQHHNIVRLVGYCHDTRQEYVQYNGRLVVADKIYRALCFEYAPNRSLHENLSDEYSGIDWRTRYGIIKGVCDGLKYLHHELKPPMYHLDLKPANVLLDENMVPKVADFGLSRLFGEEQTKITLSSMGTRGYLPPEYIEQNVLSNKFDIFSLGVVIIKVMAGPMGYSKCGEMSSQEFVKLVHENWRTRLQTPPICEPEPEAYYEQVRTCIEIALRCVEVDRHKRPTISYIVDTMNETQTKIRLWSPLAQRSQSFASAITGLRRIEYSDLAAAIDIFSVDDQPSVPKRLKTGPALPNVPEHDIHKASNSNVNPGFLLQETHPKLLEQNENTAYLKQDADVKTDIRPLQKPVKISYPTDGNVPTARHNVMSTDVTALKSGKPKIKGVSLTELFTPEQINAHIDSLRLWIGQSKAKAEKNQLMLSFENENSCQLCKVEKLTFKPPPIYCSPCGAEIKRNAPFYTVGTGDTRHFFCIPCYNESRGDTIEVDGLNFLKARFEKIRNDEETEEWVSAHLNGFSVTCECWQHQICALFNGRRNDGGQAEYTCPYCYIKEVECGLRLPLPQSAVLGASDLPRTVLSDHIEERLFKRLKLERQTRASQSGHSFDEVAGAEGLVVRVVSSVDKKVEVKPHFLEIFQEDNYPTEFPYKSKAVLLFQKIEGVEVCLFGMYVQEFGAECAYPNQRRVYLSYLDSVKYFRPEIKAASGEALRTFVYHEILIGYLEYCKQRGFTSCYIWACPPLKGEDYILYCHPEIQKTPKSEKLREWFLAMLQKATKEEIVVELTNLYDHFFITMGECKAKVTTSRLPYFDGDYWRGAAEDMINQIRQEEDDRKLQKKSKAKKIFTKKALKAAGYTDLSSNASKDAMLMQKVDIVGVPNDTKDRDDILETKENAQSSGTCLGMPLW